MTQEAYSSEHCTYITPGCMCTHTHTHTHTHIHIWTIFCLTVSVTACQLAITIQQPTQPTAHTHSTTDRKTNDVR